MLGNSLPSLHITPEFDLRLRIKFFITPTVSLNGHLLNLLLPLGEVSLDTETALPLSHGFLGGVSAAGVGGRETPLVNLPGVNGPPAGDAPSRSSLSSSSSSSPILEMSRRLA